MGSPCISKVSLELVNKELSSQAEEPEDVLPRRSSRVRRPQDD